MTNVFYFDSLNSIGGIETFFYQLGKKYGKDYDITLFYRNGDPNQIKRLSKYIKLRRYREGKKIKCKRAFVCFNSDILNDIEAEEYYQMLHGDYTAMQLFPREHKKIQKRVAVSKVVRESYLKAKGIDSIVSYNPYTPEKPRKVLNLISATRLTKEKGWNRMVALADELDKAGIPFQWIVYTDNTTLPMKNKSMVFAPPRLDVVDFVAKADYFVQLSDVEGYCYSIVEALSVGTPVIVTDFPVAHEIGIKNGENGFVLRMDMKNLPLDDIYKGLKKFKYDTLPDKWDELLVKGKTEEEDPNAPVMIRCTKVYFDLEFNKLMEYGDVWEVEPSRADILYDLGVIEYVTE